MIKLKYKSWRTETALAILSSVLFALPAAAFIIQGDPADGEIEMPAATVDTVSEEHHVGHSGSNGNQQVSSIYLFELPDISSSADIFNSALLFSHNNNSGSFQSNPANADVWGLGYVASTAIPTTWHFSGNTDTRTGNDLGTGIGTNPVVKVAESILSPESEDPSISPHRIAVADSGLKDFLQLLYDEGASEGDYAVIRINVDEGLSTLNRRFDLASADDVDVADRPELRINESTVLLFDTFDDGDRVNGADPRDTDWYSVGNFSSFGVVAGFDGNGLANVLTSSPARELGAFPEVVLEELGDFVRFSVDFQGTFYFGVSAEAFRMGLYSSGGAPVTADTTSSSNADAYEGNMVKMSTKGQFDFAGTRFALWGDPAPTLLGGNSSSGPHPHNDSFSREENGVTVAQGDVYNLTMTITKTSETGTTTRAQLQNLDPLALENVVLIGEDPGSSNSDSNVFFRFDSVVMGSNPGQEAADFIADNILVETGVSRTVANAEAATAAVELVFSTQPGVRYGLEAATDLAAADWTDQGVTVIGDGGTSRVYDSGLVDPDKAYRLTQKP